MQITIMPTNTIQAPPPQKQNYSEPSNYDFSNHLSQRIENLRTDSNNKKSNSSAQDEKTFDDTELSTPQVMEIPITDAMLQLMALFMNQAGQAADVASTQAADVPLLTTDSALQIVPLSDQLIASHAMTVSPNIVIPNQNSAQTELLINNGTAENPNIDNTAMANTQGDDGIQIKPQDVNMPYSALMNAADDGSMQTGQLQKAVAQPVIANEAEASKDANMNATDTLAMKDTTAKVSQTTENQASNADEGFADNKNGAAAFELQSNKNLVKISDSSTKLDTPKTQSPQTQLVDTLKDNLKAGKTEFEMQLTPLNLGKITVKMVSQNGVLTVEFLADNPKTQSMLMSNVSEIRELIQGSVNPTAQVTTPNQSEGTPQNYTQQESNNSQNGQNQGEQSNGEHHNNEQNQNEQNETSTVDFLSVLKQLKAQTRTTFI